MTRMGYTAAVVACVWAGDGEAARLLIGNTEGNDIKLVDTVAGTIAPFIAPGAGGLVSPDDLVFGPGGDLFVSSSASNSEGEILRYDGATGAFVEVFATSDTLRRPYGLAFAPDGLLYVASFRSDEILRYDATSGDFVDVFAAGTGSADGLNGPNDLLFGPDGKLYVSTQGSVADADGDISFAFESQILRYDIDTGAGEVFAPQPDPDPASFGFVSFLGLAEGPDGNLWTSDFANGLRVYDFETGMLEATLSTNYTGTVPSGNFIGSLAFAGDSLFVPGFENGSGANLGGLLEYDVSDPGAVPGFETLFADSPELLRPIGVALQPATIPLPAGGWLLAGGLVAMRALGRARRLSPVS